MAFAFFAIQNFKNKNLKREIFSSIAYQESKEEKSKHVSLNNTKYKKGVPKSDEQKEKLRKAITGYRHTDESKKKLSESLKGKIFTDDHRKNISIAAKKQIHTKEQNRKFSESIKGINNGMAKKVYQKLNGEVINTFNLMIDALNYANSISEERISKSTFHRRIVKNKELLGFMWEY